MSIRGVYQLMRLELKYCDHSGSSRHLRNFLENHLKTLREEWSHLDITTTVRRGRHPHVTGTYRNGRQKTVDLKNKEEDAAKLTPDDLQDSEDETDELLLRSCRQLG